LLYNPEFVRSCDDCEKYHYGDDGKIVRKPHLIGLPVLRIGATPCHKCPKIPSDAPVKGRAFAVEMSQQNWLAYEHYLECRAVGQFPADPIIRRWASLIRRVEDGHSRNQVVGRLEAIVNLLPLLKHG
jgi:hypothetical protein